MAEYTVFSLQERPDLCDRVQEMTSAAWPEFMHQDPVGGMYWPRLEVDFPDFQFVLLDSGTEAVVASGHSLPLAWEGDLKDLPDGGWNWAIRRGFEDLEAGKRPCMQCALAVVIAQAYRGKDLSSQMVRTMRAIGEMQGFETLIVPVRPNMKSLYPLAPMSRYVAWENEDGLPLDSWMRVHARLGAEIVKVCSRSMRIIGSVADWEAWTDMRFPDTGSYIVPEALVPVEVDREADEGVYVEPNVWMKHTIS